jgi:hypothetical protein
MGHASNLLAIVTVKELEQVNLSGHSDPDPGINTGRGRVVWRIA